MEICRWNKDIVWGHRNISRVYFTLSMPESAICNGKIRKHDNGSVLRNISGELKKVNWNESTH
jgi:hypothetical protein